MNSPCMLHSASSTGHLMYRCRMRFGQPTSSSCSRYASRNLSAMSTRKMALSTNSWMAGASENGLQQ